MIQTVKLQAGASALQEIEENGFSQEHVKMMLGASGGAKWLVLAELDKYLCGDFFKERNTALHLLGSSIGSWRFACYALKDPLKAIEQFKEEYISFGVGHLEKDYERLTKEDFTKLLYEMLCSFTGKSDNGAEEIINNPIFKLNIIGAESKGLLKSENSLALLLGLTPAVISNAFSRRSLKYFFKRTLFYTDPLSPFFHINDLPTAQISLTADNLQHALLASGSIPFATEGVKNIAGTNPKNVYRDGGMIDYHFDIENKIDSGLILYPHFYDFAIPGWFDKITKTRTVCSHNYDRVVMVSPSDEFVKKLPYQKIPDRKDAENLLLSDRIKYWRKVADMGKYIADDFHELVSKGNIISKIKPFQK